MPLPPLQVEVICSAERLSALRVHWDELHRAIGGTIFQTHVWNKLWWKHYGTGYDLSIVAVWSDQKLRGIFPFFREKIRLGPISVARLRLLGTRHIYGEYTPLIHPETVDEVEHVLGKWISEELNSRSSDIIEFFRYDPDCGSIDNILAIVDGSFHVSRQAKCIPRAVMNLPETTREYLEKLSGVERTMLKRRQRSLARAGMTIEKAEDTHGFASAFEDFQRLHSATWEGRGHGGYFESVEGFGQFLHEACSALLIGKMTRFYFLRLEQKRIAAVLTFSVNHHCCFYLSGLDRTSNLVRYSPGKVLLAHAITEAIEEGLKVFDFQGGDEEYKFRLGGTLSWFPKALIWRKDSSRVKILLFLSLQYLRNNIFSVVIKEHLIPWIRRVARLVRLSH